MNHSAAAKVDHMRWTNWCRVIVEVSFYKLHHCIMIMSSAIEIEVDLWRVDFIDVVIDLSDELLKNHMKLIKFLNCKSMIFIKMLVELISLFIKLFIKLFIHYEWVLYCSWILHDEWVLQITKSCRVAEVSQSN